MSFFNFFNDFYKYSIYYENEFKEQITIFLFRIFRIESLLGVLVQSVMLFIISDHLQLMCVCISQLCLLFVKLLCCVLNQQMILVKMKIL